MFDFDEKLVEDININLDMLADNNIYKKYITETIINKNNTTSEDTKSVFMLDEECDNKEENDNSINKTNNNLQSFQPTFKFFNTFIKKETTKKPNISAENVINKTNTPKSIEKIIYTLPDLDKNQTYYEDNDVFKNFDFTSYDFENKDESNKIEIEESSNEIEIEESSNTLNITQITKKKKEDLLSSYEIFKVASDDIKLFDNYIQSIY